MASNILLFSLVIVLFHYNPVQLTDWQLSEEEIPTHCKDHNCLLSDLTKIPKLTTESPRWIVRVELDELSEKMKEKAENDLKETAENIATCIPKLQALLREEKEKNGLVVPNNKAWLKRFLRERKYNTDNAFERIKNYYSFKIRNKKLKELYNGLKPSNEKNLFDQDIMTVLPLRDQEGHRIMVMELGKKWKYNKCTLDEVFKGAALFLELAVLEPVTQISGAIVIFDMKDLSKTQLTKFSAGFISHVVELLQTATPIKIRAMHVVNQPPLFTGLLNMFKKFMKPKFKERIHQHGKNWSKLHEHILPKDLPPEYGGSSNVPRISGPEWYKVMSMLDEEYEGRWPQLRF